MAVSTCTDHVPAPAVDAPAPVVPGGPSTALVGEAVVRRWERGQGRHLLDTRLGGWRDLDSEALLITRAHWGSRAADALQRASGTPFVAFCDGAPQHAAQISVHADALGGTTMTHDQLVTAAVLGPRYWLYLVFACSTGQPRLLVVQHPAVLAWSPSSGPAPGGTHPTWHLSAHDLRGTDEHVAAA